MYICILKERYLCVLQVKLIPTFLSTCFANWQMLQLNLICFLATHTHTPTRTTVTCMVNLISSIVVARPPPPSRFALSARLYPSLVSYFVRFLLAACRKFTARQCCQLLSLCVCVCVSRLGVSVWICVCVCACVWEWFDSQKQPPIDSSAGLQFRAPIAALPSAFCVAIRCLQMTFSHHLLMWQMCVPVWVSLNVCVCATLGVCVCVSRNRTQIHFCSCCCTVKRDKKWCEYRRSRSVAMRSTAFGSEPFVCSCPQARPSPSPLDSCLTNRALC